MPAAPHRLPAIDAARGVAIVAMVAYHLCWDLTILGFADFDLFGNPLWLAARTVIVCSFLGLVGVGLALGAERGFDRRRFLRRLAVLAAAAASVSAMSYILFPDSPIFFGVLHHIAVASVLGLAFLRVPAPVAALLGVLVFALPEFVSLPAFDAPWLRWVGLMTYAPTSNDYVPIFPWFGAVLAGIALGPAARRLEGWRPRGTLVWAGRHSLPIYLIHQPVLFGTLWLAAFMGAAEPRESRDFRLSCEATCMRDNGAEFCARYCRCVVDGLQAAGLWRDVLDRRYAGDTAERVGELVQRCR